MRFLVDAQLPRRISYQIQTSGHDSVHTLDLPDGNRTTDSEILRIASRDTRVVVTKDADFVTSHLLTGQPQQLLLISTGNISNAALAAVLLPNLSKIVAAFATCDFVELTPSTLILHS